MGSWYVSSFWRIWWRLVLSFVFACVWYIFIQSFHTCWTCNRLSPLLSVFRSNLIAQINAILPGPSPPPRLPRLSLSRLFCDWFFLITGRVCLAFCWCTTFDGVFLLCYLIEFLPRESVLRLCFHACSGRLLLTKLTKLWGPLFSLSIENDTDVNFEGVAALSTYLPQMIAVVKMEWFELFVVQLRVQLFFSIERVITCCSNLEGYIMVLVTEWVLWSCDLVFVVLFCEVGRFVLGLIVSIGVGGIDWRWFWCWNRTLLGPMLM